MPYADLRAFIDRLGAEGELKSVKRDVDWNLELSHVAKLNEEQQGGGSALLFENIRDHPAGYWPKEVARRKELFAKLSEWSPIPALGEPPEVVTEPFTIMLWGITTESIQNWLGLGDGEGDTDVALNGFAASPGTVEGPARVITNTDQLSDVQQGDILVCPITNPSWGPVFSKIGAAVTDIGGMMSHASIVCREYGVPAVVGTGFATKRIETGMRLRVDGTAGTVAILD